MEYMTDHAENRIEVRIEMSLCLIRHGQTASNEAHRYIGRTDEGLSEGGRLQLRELLDRISQGVRSEDEKENENGLTADLLFAGPMKRCRETADILYADMEPIIIPEWTEIDFGDFEGHTYEELKSNADYQAWLVSGGKLPFPNGESREHFIARSMRGYERMMEHVGEWKERNMQKIRQRQDAGQSSPQKLRVAAVVHGGTVMAICSSLLGGDYFDYQIVCGGMYQCPFVLL